MRNILTLAALYFLTIVTFANAAVHGSGTFPNIIDPTLGNIGIGNSTLASVTSGNHNICFGQNACEAITTGSYNAVLGNYTVVTSDGLTTGSNNVFVGFGLASTGATTNAVGVGIGNILGNDDVGIGNNALASGSTGTGNIAIGTYALLVTSTGNNGIALGYYSMYNADNSTANIAVGAYSGSTLTSGTNNLILGDHVASTTLTIGSNNILIGTTSAIDATTSSTSNSINIGGVWKATGTNAPTTAPTTIAGTLALTNIASDATHTDAAVCEDTTTHILYAGSGAAGICLGTSSARYKTNIKPLTDTKIMDLQPVTFYYKKGYGDTHKQYYGFIAEDVIKKMPKLVGLDKDGKPNSVDMVGAIPSIVLTLQQQQTELTTLHGAFPFHKCFFDLLICPN